MGEQKSAEIRKSRFYELKDGKVKRLRQPCPRCGSGVFLADHGDRLSCGKCGYTEFRKK